MQVDVYYKHGVRASTARMLPLGGRIDYNQRILFRLGMLLVHSSLLVG